MLTTAGAEGLFPVSLLPKSVQDGPAVNVQAAAQLRHKEQQDPEGQDTRYTGGHPRPVTLEELEF